MATASPTAQTASHSEFVKMSDEEALYQEEVVVMEKRGRRLRRAALTGGIMQTISLLCTIYSTIAIRWVLIEWSEPEKTAYDIAENLGMFKVGILTDSVVTITDTMVGVLIGMILIGAGVNPATSSLIIIFKVIQQSIMAVNVIFLVAAGILLDENLAIYSTIQNYFYSDNLPPIGTQVSYLMLLLNKYGSLFGQGKHGIAPGNLQVMQ
jgi:hypothetical protein